MDTKILIFDAITENDVNLVRDLISQINTFDFYQITNNDYKTPLMLASMLGYDEIIIMLLRAGADINFPNPKLNTALIYAVEFNHITSVQILLDAGANVNLKAGDGLTALKKAAEKGYKEIVLTLINAGADVNILDIHNQTALYISIIYGHKEIALALINAGANVNLQNNDGYTALFVASYEGHKEIALALINAGADVNILSSDRSTALIAASDLDHQEIALALINAGADVNLQNMDGITALMKAAGNDNKEIVLSLIKAEADVNLQNMDGITALMKAADGHKEIVLALIDAGANINLQNARGITALIIASSENHEEIVTMLLNAGADMDIQSRIRKETALMNASEFGYGKIVSILLEAGADINLKDKNGLTALAFAFERNHLNIADLIKNYVPDDPDQIDSDGFTNLMIVASNGPTYKLREFLRRVKDIDAQDPRGNTALIYAVKYGDLQRAELLLNAEANPLLENLKGKSAYHYMMKSSDPKIRKLGNDVFIASTQSDIVTSEFGTFRMRRAAERFRREYQEGEEINFPENLRPEFREYYAECAKENNWEKVFLLAEILEVPREGIESKSQEEICGIIRRFISLLT